MPTSTRETRLAQPPLHEEAQRGDTETARALIDTGAYPDSRDENGEKPLDLVARRGQTETAQVPIAAGAHLS